MKKQINNRRGGFTLLEILVAVFILIAASGLTLTAVGTVGKARARIADRQAGHQEAANALERLTAVPFDKLDAAAKKLQPSDLFTKRVKKSRMNVSVVNESDAPDGTLGKKITVEVDWNDATAGPIRLTSWRFMVKPVEKPKAAEETATEKPDEKSSEPSDEKSGKALEEKPSEKPEKKSEKKSAEESAEESPAKPETEKKKEAQS